jgi:selenocysteine-specific elongation factor
METTHYILATAGHVDHGKSALVKSLSGTDPDRLPEEKSRGITIDLGFAHIDLPAAAGRFRVGIVDVPGHEDFVKNMVAGVGSIDVALLVVAADDGWMPQTEEHLQILEYLGVRHGVVALTKIDLTESEAGARDAVREKLRGSRLADAPIVATSVVTGHGIEELKTTLSNVLKQVSPQRDLGKPRLAVDRVFTLRGVGTVVTGTLSGGTLRRGQSAMIQPGAKPARIRTVQSYNAEVDVARPGARVALNLPDLQIGSATNSATTVSRGDVITLPELGRGSDTIDAAIEMSARSPEARPLKTGTLIRVHHGSGNFPGFVYLHGSSPLSPGSPRLAQLRFEMPFFAFAGDRFVIRDWSEQRTLAGGIVLDADAPRRRFHSPERQAFLAQRAAHPEDAGTFVQTELRQDGVTRPAEHLAKTRFGPAEIAVAVESLKATGKALARGEVLADADWWQGTMNSALAAIDAAHASRPEEAGIRLADLRSALPKQAARPEVFDEVIADLCRNGCVKTGVAVRRAAHRPALPPRLQPAGAKLRMALSAKLLEPPSRKELTPDSVSQQAMRFLLETGEVIEIGDELVLHHTGYQKAVDAIRTHIRANGGASVSELRQVLNTSRRIMVPLLEKLDRDGITLRQGDKRVLRHSTT